MQFEGVLVIKEIVDGIKSFDYSPLEQALYAYDLVRDRFCVMEEYDLNSDIERIKLIRTLRNVLDTKLPEENNVRKVK